MLYVSHALEMVGNMAEVLIMSFSRLFQNTLAAKFGHRIVYLSSVSLVRVLLLSH